MKKETIIKNSKLRGGRPPTVHKDKKKYDRKRDKKIPIIFGPLVAQQ